MVRIQRQWEASMLSRCLGSATGFSDDEHSLSRVQADFLLFPSVRGSLKFSPSPNSFRACETHAFGTFAVGSDAADRVIKVSVRFATSQPEPRLSADGHFRTRPSSAG